MYFADGQRALVECSSDVEWLPRGAKSSLNRTVGKGAIRSRNPVKVIGAIGSEGLICFVTVLGAVKRDITAAVRRDYFARDDVSIMNCAADVYCFSAVLTAWNSAERYAVLEGVDPFANWPVGDSCRVWKDG